MRRRPDRAAPRRPGKLGPRHSAPEDDLPGLARKFAPELGDTLALTRMQVQGQRRRADCVSSRAGVRRRDSATLASVHESESAPREFETSATVPELHGIQHSAQAWVRLLHAGEGKSAALRGPACRAPDACEARSGVANEPFTTVDPASARVAVARKGAGRTVKAIRSPRHEPARTHRSARRSS
jgi:hypothetical protein